MTKIKPPYSDGRVELNGGADRIRDAQISWNTLFQDVPRGLGRFLSPPNGFSSLPEITPHVTQGCAHLYTNATKKHPKSEPRFKRLT